MATQDDSQRPDPTVETAGAFPGGGDPAGEAAVPAVPPAALDAVLGRVSLEQAPPDVADLDLATLLRAAALAGLLAEDEGLAAIAGAGPEDPGRGRLIAVAARLPVLIDPSARPRFDPEDVAAALAWL